jgi:hypothetical protein
VKVSPSTVPSVEKPPTTSVETVQPPTTSVVTPLNTGDVIGFEVGEVGVDGETWTVAIADDSDERARGLMAVDDLGDLDGMLFVFDGPASVAFWMKNALSPLDIAFFGADARLTEVMTMPVCDADPCPTYRSSRPALYALEAPAGELAALAEQAVLEPAQSSRAAIFQSV